MKNITETQKQRMVNSAVILIIMYLILDIVFLAVSVMTWSLLFAQIFVFSIIRIGDYIFARVNARG